MDSCSGIPGLDYGEFSKWLHAKVGNQRIPVTGSLEVTMRCNLRCAHCYISEEQRTASRQPELSLAEVQRILDEITEAGCLWLLLTGGEPFLRPDFLDLYTYAKQKGLLLTLFSNGTLITPRIADYLADWRPFYMEITLYGATQETYERVTGIPGSYAKCRRGIDLLLERGLPLGLKTMALTLNQSELDQMKALARELGTSFKFDPILNSALDRSSRPLGYSLTPEEIVALEIADPERAQLWPIEIQQAQPISGEELSMYLCAAGKQGFHIDATGNLSICMLARQPSYSLRSGSFREGWDTFFPQVITQQYRPDFDCLGCQLRPICPQCPAVADLASSHPDQRIEFICRLTHLRSVAFSTQYTV